MTPTDRARELVDEAAAIFSDGKARPRARVEAKIAAALQREREEAAERARNCEASQEMDESESWGWQLGREDAYNAILADQPKGKEKG
jgi:hypothetical protein